MPTRTRLRLLVATLLLPFALLAPSVPTAYAEDGGGIGPGPVDPIIELLPPFPMSHTPYVGKVCKSGSVGCIDRAITNMQKRLKPLAASCSHRAVFSLAYLRVTQNVRKAVGNGYFKDAKWLNQVDAVFAKLYFNTLDNWKAGRRDQVPRAWAIALKAEDDHAMSGLGNFMLAMNAHINRDFPHVLAEVGLTARNGVSHKSDHNRYNKRLDTLYGPVFKEEAKRFDPTFDDIDIGPIEETAAGLIMRGWREGVWRHAEELRLATTPAMKRLAEQQIEVYAATQAVLIRQLLGADSTQRDAYCAAR